MLPRVAPVMRIFWPDREKRLRAGVDGVGSMLVVLQSMVLQSLSMDSYGPSSGEKCIEYF